MLEHLSADDRRRIVLARLYAQRAGMPTHFAREVEGAVERGGDRVVIDSIIARMKEDEDIRGTAPAANPYPLNGRYRLAIGGELRNVRVRTDKNTFQPRVYEDAPKGRELINRDEVKTVRAMLDEPGARLDALLAYGHAVNACGRCGRALKTATSIARGLGDECAEAVAWALGDLITGADLLVTPRRYLVTFERVGRSEQGVPAPVKLRALDADHLAEQLAPIILPRLRSSDVEIVVDLDAGRGQILAGSYEAGELIVGRNAGSFTIEPVPAATTEPEATR